MCFPNRWDLASKLGRTMAEVHAPVARLNATLEPEVDRFLDRLRPERPFWRLGWGIIDVADGYTPADGTGGPRPVDPEVSGLFVRVERETLRRFPRTGCVLFTIRTYIAPIASVAEDPESAAALAAAVAGMTADVRRLQGPHRTRRRRRGVTARPTPSRVSRQLPARILSAANEAAKGAAR